MNRIFIVLLIFANLSSFAQPKVNVDKQLKLSAQQYKGMLKEFQDTKYFPQSVNKDGSYKKKTSEWWCTGFFSGSLWNLYDYTKDQELKSGAIKWTEALEKEQYNKGTHDLGFMLYCSYGNGYRLTKNEAYKPILLQGAESLSTRFDPKVGVIKSWENFKEFKYPVIIDNMMNLEFLFWASKVSGNNKYRDLSIVHADNTLKNHFRPDNSSYHVIAYDSVGNVLAKKTAQGAADNSAWARGQAWGLYGYTVMYRETKQKRYLDQAVKIANFYINHPNMPKDKVPYWDFNAPDIPNEERDASAAAISASALLELSKYVKKDLGKKYNSFAEDVLVSLSSPEYFAASGNNNFILKHSTGHKPAKSEIDTPIIYADYYYIEALLRYQALNKTKAK
ncbi:MAG: glucuronyl hydrolase [Sphingobacteriales bacterium]|nr:glucuronyl hydrolase [Sphingobacteriales bacterium]